MSLYEGRANAILVAALLTAAAFVMGVKIINPYMPLLFTIIAAVLFVFTSALIGIVTVMIPVGQAAQLKAPGIALLLVVLSNCALVWFVALLIPGSPRSLEAGFAINLPFATISALIWLTCDHFLKKVPSDA